ncbi:hypothetical protein TSH58p_26185 (plasmid) [Azospirillum sp. TSH58]|uniref:hypothetical protein n=1 Tax=Azospirillum sp. TSH58 TaxID=664962 RepID=UPI000D601FBB|nr:hypothetical protein [Azospirillum sp. TSH58]AWJ86916.1 hypothetical protein TSH58p_26185 [Azospirillum sp. TSH58]PWC65241.1 hypothetical protein TSH58_21285 [Azospirillum sp. TSH58]
MTARTSPIASAVPGRIRVRHPLLRRADRFQEALGSLESLDSVRITGSNPAVGSFLLSYDPAAVAPDDARSQVEALLSAVLHPAEAPPPDTPAPAPAAASKPAAPELKWRINRAAKIGMMGSMAATLAALGVGKRVHAGFGTLFVAFMLVHMTVQRKRLFQ